MTLKLHMTTNLIMNRPNQGQICILRIKIHTHLISSPKKFDFGFQQYYTSHSAKPFYSEGPLSKRSTKTLYHGLNMILQDYQDLFHQIEN